MTELSAIAQAGALAACSARLGERAEQLEASVSAQLANVVLAAAG